MNAKSPHSKARDRRVADSIPRTFVDRAPEGWRPYLRLARYDRPIGFWLLAIPCFWGLALATMDTGASWSMAGYAALFAIGAIAMRGAGCTWNDIADRDLDAKVARTADRPLAAGTITVKQALIFLAAQCAVGALVLLFLPLTAIAIALAALLLVAAYPFMKRITWWPQVWLGLTFNWGVLVGYAALGGADWIAASLLYAAAALWTLGYDTIYACQDMEDDALVGVKSSARALGHAIGPAVGAIYGTSLVLTALAAIKAGAGLIFAPVFAAYAVHLVWQASRFRPDDGAACLAHFKSNREAGLILLAALLLGALAPM
ncbi:4-hydroxybenzoate polyprenyltransferase [Glycocaulis alkaliphilus]|uniref:4-hydroxybenzoate octaprenyltransferase n=1 Tax=Glycocaulis alkaliphilus TaxID=1434191 RepID=A0A3T0E843_9PROT|nr:4-hydroxybenzoate octaprenyltransferase [Glycocaulis alkaliphilus]AZU03502.1 4-hydroxybenzoate polyprenyltransferase [Glycocaulis alkaliphilus]GGB74001.1 4-hydroxybenzoate octaprenyltransferase [Glycocaulis alkaliphilus]